MKNNRNRKEIDLSDHLSLAKRKMQKNKNSGLPSIQRLFNV